MKLNRTIKKITSLLFAALMVTSVFAAFVPAVTTNKGAANGIDFTPDELQKLYRKYNITENDIKFAEGRLPHFLEGTILDGKVVTMGMITLEENKIVVSEWIDPLFSDYFLKKGYKVISLEERLTIEERAREKYIKKFGVDPANPKIDVVDGVPLPTEYVRELVKSGKINPKESGVESLATTSSSPVGPYAKYNRLYLWIFEAKNPEHKPREVYLTDTVNALRRFFQFGVDDWPHDSIAQHEISHNFNADDQGFWFWEHPECIMNYNWAYWGTDIWCSDCWNIVYGNIIGLWE